MQGTEELDFRIKLDKKDFVSFNMEYRRKFYLLFSLVYFLLAAAMFLLINNDEPPTTLTFVFAVVVGAAVVGAVQLSFLFTMRFQVGRMFSSDRLLQYEQRYVLNDSTLAVLTQVGDSRFGWDKLYRAVEYRSSIALFVGRNRALILPKRLLDAQLPNGTAEVKRLIRSCLPPKKVKFRR
ncbi:YcxB family protein [Saccharibacillus sp. O23]|uniref:YcxB family protein n=1 Tax=Saccharibacillus sp. O23 TaxID=2009338 RepID=UPI0015C5DB06|nr:YcxB family protein [Saccharibacillus sp. O23]